MSIENNQPKDTSSIGPKWPPKESSFDRIKGIYNAGIIDNEGTLNGALEVLEEQINNMPTNIDRLSVRLFLTNELLKNNKLAFGSLGEAVIPLSGASQTFENVAIVYVGYNKPGRRSDQNDLSRALQNVETSLKNSGFFLIPFQAPSDMFSSSEARKILT